MEEKPQLRLKTLGVMRLEGARAVPGSPRKALALLAYVCRRAPRAVRREDLMALFWGERPEARARQSLRQVLLEVRQVVGESLEVGADSVRVRDGALSMDATDFERDVADGRLGEAVACWQGDFLAGTEDVGGEPYRVWLEGEREALRRKLAFAFDRLVATGERAGDWEAAVHWAQRWADALPNEIAAQCRLISALDAGGRPDEALARYSAFMVRLQRELELEPPPELVRLGEVLSRPQVASARPDTGALPALPSPAGTGNTTPFARLQEAWQAVRSGASAVVLLAGARAERSAVVAEFVRHASNQPDASLILQARGGDASPWSAARQLLMGLRQARGLSGAPDAALSELSVLVPEIRDRFPSLPRASGARDVLAEAVGRVLADVAAEVCIVLHVDEPGRTDPESRSLVRALTHQNLPGVLLLLDDEEPPLEAMGIEGAAVQHVRLPAVVTSDASKQESPRRRAWRPVIPPAWEWRRPRLAVTGTAVLALLLLAFLQWPARAPATTDRVAVLPFALHGNGAHAYVREGFAELLSSSLDGVAGWQTVDAGAVRRRVGVTGNGLDPTRARALAAQLGAGMFVLGSITESGNQLRVQATLYGNAEEGPLARATAEGSADELFSLVDRVAEQILGQGSGTPAVRFARVAALSTDSLVALKAYLDGEAQLRRLRVREAFDAFQRAVNNDSSFALGWYGLAVSASWMLAPDLAAAAAQKALLHAGHLGQRERATVETLGAFLAGRAHEAELLARSVLSQYPDDVELRMQLAEVLFHFSWRRGRPASDAEPELRRVLHADPANGPALMHLVQIALKEDRHAEVDSLLGRLMTAYGRGPTATWMAALRAGADQKKLNAALDSLQAAGDWWLALTMSDLATYSTDPEAANRAAIRLAAGARSTHARALGHVARAHLELTRGHWHNARAQLARLEPLQPEWFMEYRSLLSLVPFLPAMPAPLDTLRGRLTDWAADASPVPARPLDPRPWSSAHDRAHGLLRLYLLGLLHLRTGHLEEAATHAALIEARAGAETAPPLARGLAGSLRAQLLRLENSPAEALIVLDSTVVDAPFELAMASPFWSQALERFLRAELLTEAERYDEALGVLRTFSDHSLFDAIYRAPAVLLAGRISERQGDAAGAVIHYQHFVRLWQDCDDELRPLVREAQQRIQALRTAGRPSQ